MSISENWGILHQLNAAFPFTLSGDYNASQQSCCNAILVACEKGHWKLITEYSEQISKIRDVFGKTILMQVLDKPTWVSCLVENRVAIHEKDNTGNSALHLAIMQGAISSLPLLISHLSLQETNAQGATALHVAIQSGQVSIVRELLERGANKNAMIILGEYQFTPLLLAVMQGQRYCVDILLCEETVAQEVAGIGNIFHVAVNFHQTEMVDHLLSHRKSDELKIKDLIDKRNGRGQTPLSLAAAEGELTSLELLREHGADIETQDLLKERPIHHAARNKQHASVQLLVALSCKLTALNKNSQTALQLIENDSSSDGKSVANLLRNLMQESKDTRISAYEQFPENLAFEGDPMAYMGVLQALKVRKVPIRRATGSGRCALLATLFAVGVSVEDFKVLLQKAPWFDSSAIFHELKDLQAAIRMPDTVTFLHQQKSGTCLGESFRLWVEEILTRHTGVAFLTFGELNKLIGEDCSRYKHLLLFGKKLEDGSIIRFDSEDPTCSRMIVSDALRIAIGTPGIFQPHAMHIKEGEDRLPCSTFYLQANPTQYVTIEAYDRKKYQSKKITVGEQNHLYHNKRTLGFVLPSLTPCPEVNRVEELLNAALLRAEKSSSSCSYNESRTIKLESIETGQANTDRFFQERLSRFARYETIEILVKSLQGKIQLPPCLDNTEFAGRKTDLEKLQKLAFPDNWTPDLQASVIVLHGIGGIGKTELAITFGNQQISQFALIKLIECENSASYERCYRELGKTLGLFDVEKQNPEELVKKVHQALESTHFKQEGKAKPWLLIFDNVDKKIPLPVRGGVIIATAQEKDIIHGTHHSLLPLSSEEAWPLFPNSSLKDVDNLVVALHGLPVLLIVAKKYMQEEHLSISEYLKELKRIHPIQEKNERYDKSAEAAITLSLTRLKNRSPLAYEWLECMAYLSPDHIALSLIDCAAGKNHTRREISCPLEQSAFLSYDENKKAFSCHRLIQTILQRLMGKEERDVEVFEKTIAWVSLYSEGYDFLQLVSWKIGEHVVEQLTHLKGQMLWAEVRGTEEAIARITLLHNGGYWLLKIKNDFQGSLIIYKEALVIGTKKLGTIHLKVAESANYIGTCLRELGQYNEALIECQNALNIRQEILGNRHPDVAESLNSIGGCLWNLGKYNEAIIEHQKALDIQQEILGDKYLDVAGSFNNIGVCLWNLGKYNEALIEYQKALGIRQEALGNKHPDVAMSFNNIGNCLCSLGQYHEALIEHQKALGIRQKALGNKHTDVAGCFYNIGNCLRGLGQYNEALIEYREALTIYQEILGKKHPNVAASFNSIGVCLWNLGQYNEALIEHQKALDIRQTALGNRHPDVAASFNNIGNCLCKLGQYNKALINYGQAFITSYYVCKIKNTALIRYLNNLIIVLNRPENFSKAEVVKAKVLPLCEQAFGQNDPLIARLRSSGKQPQSAEAAITLSLTRLKNRSPLAYEWLECMAYLSPDHIALSLIDCAKGENHRLGEISYPLEQSAFLSYDENKKAFFCHRLIQTILQRLICKEERDVEVFEKTIAWVSLYSKGFEFNQLVSWKIGEHVVEQLTHLKGQMLWAEVRGTEEAIARITLLHKGGYWLQEIKNDFPSSLATYKEALVIGTEQFGTIHLKVAESFNYIGTCLRDLGKYNEAFIECQNALNIRQEILGNRHLDVAESLDSIGNCLRGLGQYNEALIEHQKALDIRRETLGEKHPSVAASFNNIGVCLNELGQYNEALIEHQKALDIQQETFGEKYPSVAASFHNIGGCLDNLGQHNEALINYEQAFIISCHACKIKNAILIRRLNNLIKALNRPENFSQAEEVKARVLPICEQILGQYDPLVASLRASGQSHCIIF